MLIPTPDAEPTPTLRLILMLTPTSDVVTAPDVDTDSDAETDSDVGADSDVGD